MVRLTYVLVYALIPIGAAFVLLPNWVGVVLAVVLLPLVPWKAWPISVQATSEGIRVTNFFKGHDIAAWRVREISVNNYPRTIFVPFPNADVPRITLDTGDVIYVVAGTGGTPRVYEILKLLGQPVPYDGRPGLKKVLHDLREEWMRRR